MHLSTKKVEKTILLMLGSNLNLKFQAEDKDIQVFFISIQVAEGLRLKMV